MSHLPTVWLKENQVRLVGSSRSFTCIYTRYWMEDSSRFFKEAPPATLKDSSCTDLVPRSSARDRTSRIVAADTIPRLCDQAVSRKNTSHLEHRDKLGDGAKRGPSMLLDASSGQGLFITTSPVHGSRFGVAG